MKTFIGSLLAVVVFFAVTVGAVDAYWHDGGAAAAGNLASSGQNDSPSDQDPQNVLGHHCEHLAQHFIGQPTAGLQVKVSAASARFEPLSARPPSSISDTPIRPPRQRLS